MAKMDELYNEIYDLCVECGRVVGPLTAKEWNQRLKNTYGSGAFTALVNAGKMTKHKGWRKSDPYYYTFIPTGKLEEEMEKSKREHEIENAKEFLERYEERVAWAKEYYGEQIAELESKLDYRLVDLEEQLENAKEILGILD